MTTTSHPNAEHRPTDEPALAFRDPDDLPLLYRCANTSSMLAQRSFFRALRLRLGGLLGAVVGAALTSWTGESRAPRGIRPRPA